MMRVRAAALAALVTDGAEGADEQRACDAESEDHDEYPHADA